MPSEHVPATDHTGPWLEMIAEKVDVPDERISRRLGDWVVAMEDGFHSGQFNAHIPLFRRICRGLEAQMVTGRLAAPTHLPADQLVFGRLHVLWGTADICMGYVSFAQNQLANAKKCLKKAGELAEPHAILVQDLERDIKRAQAGKKISLPLGRSIHRMSELVGVQPPV